MKKQIQNEILKIVEKNYSEIAEEYSQTRKKMIWPSLDEILKNVKDGQKILDVGCGSGRILDVIKEREIDYLGVDKCESMLEFSKKNYPDFKFIQGDILELGKISEIDYDYVFCIAVLHHLPGMDLRVKALKQLKNKIKKDGKIIITVWNLWDEKKYSKLIWKFWLLKFFKKNKMDFGDILFDWAGPNNINSKRYYHAFTKQELKKICKLAGLKIEKLFKDKHNYYLIIS